MEFFEWLYVPLSFLLYILKLSLLRIQWVVRRLCIFGLHGAIIYKYCIIIIIINDINFLVNKFPHEYYFLHRRDRVKDNLGSR